MDLKWTDDLSVGNSLIDSGNKELLEIAGGIVHAIEAEDCVAFSRAFELFEGKLQTHYAIEEQFAQMVNFANARYRAVEQHFFKELDLFRQELLARKCQCCGDAIKHYSDGLTRLIVEHISEKARLVRPFFRELPYELDMA